MSLNPGKHNFSIWRGATFKVTLTLRVGDATSALRDLTGYSALLEIKDRSGGTVIYTLSTTNGRIALGGVTGTIELLIPAADTAVIAWDSGVYDLTITSATGHTDPILYGGFSVRGV